MILGLPGVDLVVVGGESAQPGRSAKPCDVRWIRSVVDQCRAAGVAWWVKQIGSNAAPWDEEPSYGSPWRPYYSKVVGYGDRAGADPAEWPADLRAQRGALPWAAMLPGHAGEAR